MFVQYQPLTGSRWYESPREMSSTFRRPLMQRTLNGGKASIHTVKYILDRYYANSDDSRAIGLMTNRARTYEHLGACESVRPTFWNVFGRAHCVSNEFGGRDSHRTKSFADKWSPAGGILPIKIIYYGGIFKASSLCVINNAWLVVMTIPNCPDRNKKLEARI